MNVLHVYKDYYPVLGGIENHIKLLAEAQAARGHQVTVLVTSPGPRTEIVHLNGVRVIKAARLATVASAPISLALPLALGRERPDIAHVQSPYPVGEMAQWLLGRARRTVITYQSDVVRQKGILRLYRPFLWRVLRAADRIIATSPAYIQTSPFLSRLADRCTVIPLGVEVSHFSKASPARVAELRARYPGPLLLFVGKLRYYKGLQYLLRALPDLADVRLLVVGEGPLGKAWRALTDELGLANRVHFVGEVADADLPAYYHAADLLVFPSGERSEAFGLVMVEAMAAGLPCISTELGTGTSTVNVDGETGLVVLPRDAAALVGAIRRLLADDVLRQQMGQHAAERAEREFDLAVMVERILALYRDLLTI